MPSSYLSPGVYVEEVESGSRLIEGVGTSVAAFVGFAQKGPFNEPTLVTNWTQFVTVFGDFVEGTYLATSVYGYFANGGGVCYVIRIGGPRAEREPDGAGASHEEIDIAPHAQLGPYVVRTLPGVTGEITVEVADSEIEDPPQDAFKLIVRHDGQVAETYPSGDHQAQQGERRDAGHGTFPTDRPGGAWQGRGAAAARAAVGSGWPCRRAGPRAWRRRR